MSTDEIRALPDGREAVITEITDVLGTLFLARLASDPDGPWGYGPDEGEAMTGLLVSEFCHKMGGLRRAREAAGIGDESDLPPGYRRYVHHIDGNARNNDPENLVIVRGDGRR